MEISSKINLRILLFSLVAIVAPLVAFPELLGTDLTPASLVHALFELAFYAFVIFLFHRRTSLLKMVQGAGICLIYRFVLGAIFGLFVAALYSMDVQVSLSIGMSSYLPAILFQIAITPFILKPVVDSFYSATPEKSRLAVTPAPPSEQRSGRTSIVVTEDRGVVQEDAAARQVDTPPPMPIPSVHEVRRSEPVISQDLNGFERAVRYIGEQGSVHLAAVVDNEGLLLASFKRGEILPDEWAPLALLFVQGNCEVLNRNGMDDLKKLDLHLEEKRLVVAQSTGYCLMVLSERQDDDMLSIRINQALDMINRFVAERYGDKLNSNVEKIHVSSAQ